MTESLLSDFEKILDDRIEDLSGMRYMKHTIEAYNPVYNESLMIEIENAAMGFILCTQVKTRIVFLTAMIT